MANIWAIPLALSNFNIVLAVLGGFVSIFGLVSYLLKDTFYLSEALISLLVGVALGPNAANLIRPDAYAYAPSCSPGDPDPSCRGIYLNSLDSITLNFSRLVLGLQLVIAGVQLPSKYLWRQWRPVSLLLGPGMTLMWFSTSLLVWGLAGTPSLLHALAVGACVTPTDPVLSAVIVNGRFADQNVPRELRDLVVAESGANDGLGYPFLFLALYLIRFVGEGATTSSGDSGDSGDVRDAISLWFAFTWCYIILLSVVYGAAVGWLAKELLRWAKHRGYIDRESFLVSALSTALFVIGTCGLIGTDDVLACFVAGSALAWDGWFREETKDDHLLPVVDMLLNVSVFLWYGAVIPWASFGDNTVIPTSRLVVLGILVLLLRRLPWILAMHRMIPQLRGTRDALFVGFFGPIGVSGAFYLFVTLEFINEHLSDEDGVPRWDVRDLSETVRVVVWFLVVVSTVVHGLSVPLGKMGYLCPPAIRRAMSDSLSVFGADSRLSSRAPTISRLLGGSRGTGSRGTPETEVEDDSGVVVLAPPPPPPSPGSPRPVAVSGSSIAAGRDVDETMPAGRREIRFYDEPG